ncbi:O-antigen ligase family protein [Klebsiella grimontii]|uniref:O-antigen ligase family protein n=1 Tax=Klebsiella grimontii TaxID=2058152 RepID=UPI0012B6F89D|nr:O-antigen ligase family protein [Klebsiella grimontii]MDT8623225.1 O-antigen ligase family protein [Klebsiella grimontii]MEB7548541.1 O-antigen ligase family protein [Klebsiella grimontii]UNF13021.1 O-antigen ligase family protein [Klebsiella grimontii]UTJ42567.1 O-antigen ligase family protein [Klebsiella grimontii]
MSTLKISSYARQGYTVFFTLFLFFSAVFCVSTRTNNLLHLSISLFLLSLLNHDNRQALAESIRQRWLVYILLVVFCVYYALSNIWGQTPQHIDSPLTHGAYLFFYLLLLTTLLGDPRTRHLALLSVVAGITVLSIWTMAIDFTLVLKERLVSPGNPGPTNVIDLAGYCGIGILICAMLLKEKGSHLLYVPMAIMLVMLFLTQSRGPIIALLAAFVCTLHLHVFTRRNVLIVAALALVLGALFFFTPTGDLLLARFEELGTQSGLRLSIWHHTLQEVASQPWLGRGFDYELNFTNYSGEHITTTHSVYLGALLKGGIIGLALLLAVIAGGLWQAWRNQQDGRYGLAIFIYALIFMASQGMFIISNPRESWPLFWLPLGIALSGGLKAKR